jgi:hypothetical protein
VHRVGAQDFHKAIDKAKSANAYGVAVELHPAEQYKSIRTCMTPDGGGGFALDSDNIVSVFKHPDSSSGATATAGANFSFSRAVACSASATLR